MESIWENFELIATVVAVFGAGAVNFVAWMRETLGTKHKDEIKELRRDLNKKKDECSKVTENMHMIIERHRLELEEEKTNATNFKIATSDFKKFEREIAIYFCLRKTRDFGGNIPKDVNAWKNHLRKKMRRKLTAELKNEGRDPKEFLANTKHHAYHNDLTDIEIPHEKYFTA